MSIGDDYADRDDRWMAEQEALDRSLLIEADSDVSQRSSVMDHWWFWWACGLVTGVLITWLVVG